MMRVQPSSKQEAEQQYVGQPVRKYFEADDDFEGGWFSGKVLKVEAGLPDADGNVYDGLLYLIRYDDGDSEHVTYETLQSILLEPATPAHQLGLPHGNENQGGNRTHISGRPRGNGSSRHKPPPPVFSDVTNQRKQLTLTSDHPERRSRRAPKRKTDEEFEYEEPRTAKRGNQTGAPPTKLASRFGIKAPTPGGGASGVAAALATESEEEVPLADGIRTVGLPGHLKHIELVNFMCHEHFTMDFGAHVTFVSGTNGSGKSAVLQALQCCLGVKASQTGRAPSFKHFIRTGTDEAIVRVTLHNKPYKDFDAFQHEVYGDSITVERRIARVGTASAYFLRDHSGRVHGKRRDDLDALLQALGINAANPVTVMTQDTARSFLAGSSVAADREKWALYMDATQLSQIRYNLEISKGQIRVMDESVAKIRAEYEVMQKEHDELAKALEALRGLEVWRCEIRQYEQVLAWALIDDHQRSVDSLEQALGTIVPQRLADTNVKVEELQTRYNALKQGAEEKEQFLLNFTHRAQGLSVELEQFKAQRAEAHKLVGLAKRKLSHIQKRLEDEAGRKESLLAAVQETASEMMADTQAITMEYTHKLEEADRQHKAVQTQAKAATEAKSQADAELQEAVDMEARVKQDLRTNSTQVKRVMENLQQAKHAKKNALARFGGTQMVELVGMIQRSRGRFHKPPIGPLGHYLVLKDNKYARAVEAALSLSLNAFLVCDLHDCRLLQQLVRQSGLTGYKKPSVTAVKFDLPAYQVPAGAQPPGSVPTLLRMLSCSHPQQAHTVINHLIDVAHIERVALCETHEDGKRLGWRTPNVSNCFGLQGNKYYRRGKTESSLGPPFWMQYQAPRLGADAQDQDQALKGQLQQLQQEASQLNLELQAANQRLGQAGEAAKAARVAYAGLQTQTHRTRYQLEQLLSQPPPELAASQAAADGGSAEDEVQREILEATQAVVDLEQQLGEKEQELQAAERGQQEAHEAFLSKKEELDRLADENAQFVTNYQADQEQVAQVEAELLAATENCQLIQRQKAQLEQQLAEQQQVLETLLEMTPQLCTREEAAACKDALAAGLREKEGMDDEKLERWFTVKIMRKKVERLQKKVTDHERQAGGTLADLEVRNEAVQGKMNSDGRRFQAALTAHSLMTTALQRRFDKLAKLFGTVSEAVNKRFNYYMARKGHLGSIKLDTDAQTLQLKVQIGGKSGGDSGKVKDLKQLSGGERSYTTVAFTLALGAQTDMPFRCADEFDVYMDAINRRVAMESLFQFAHECSDLQFVFLTPQDIAAVEDAKQGCKRTGINLPEDFVRVVQMRPARQNATHA